MTRFLPENSSRSTAPIPGTPSSQAPSVKTRMVRVSKVTGTVLGFTDSKRASTSSHQHSRRDWFCLPWSTSVKILKQAYLKNLPAKYPVAKFSKPCNSWASASGRTPACRMQLFGLFCRPCRFYFGQYDNTILPWVFSCPKSKVMPKTSKLLLKSFPFGPVRSCLHPRRPRKSETTWSVSSASPPGLAMDLHQVHSHPLASLGHISQGALWALTYYT